MRYAWLIRCYNALKLITLIWSVYEIFTFTFSWGGFSWRQYRYDQNIVESNIKPLKQNSSSLLKMKTDEHAGFPAPEAAMHDSNRSTVDHAGQIGLSSL